MTRYRLSAVATVLVCATLVAVLSATALNPGGNARARTDASTASWTAKALAPERWWSAATFIPATCEVLAFGGDSFDSTGSSTNPRDTLLYSSNSDRWTILSPQRSGPPSLKHHTLSWDPNDGVGVMFGGTSGGLTNLTYGFQPSTRTWTRLINPTACTATTCPSPRVMHAQAWSTSLGATLVFGGSTGYALAAVTNDLWALRAAQGKRGTLTWQWTRLNPKSDPTYGAPPARSRHGMAEIPPGGLHGGKMLIYGGLNDKGEPLSDTWLYDPVSNTYQMLESAGSPTPRQGFGMAYSPTLDDVVIQGGQTNSMAQCDVYTHETWAFDRYAGVWVRVVTNDPLGDRSYHDLASDTCDGSVVVFDQYATAISPQQRTWVMK